MLKLKLLSIDCSRLLRKTVAVITFTAHSGILTKVLANVYGLLGPCFKTGQSVLHRPTYSAKKTTIRTVS